MNEGTQREGERGTYKPGSDIQGALGDDAKARGSRNGGRETGSRRVGEERGVGGRDDSRDGHDGTRREGRDRRSGILGQVGLGLGLELDGQRLGQQRGGVADEPVEDERD
jgi:hypothetical protein